MATETAFCQRNRWQKPVHAKQGNRKNYETEQSKEKREQAKMKRSAPAWTANVKQEKHWLFAT